jgi:hypothetical protein
LILGRGLEVRVDGRENSRSEQASRVACGS